MSPCSNTFWFLRNSRIVFPNPTLARKTFASNSSLAGFPIGASFGSTNVINSRGLIEQRRRSQQGHCFRSLPKEINPGLPAVLQRKHGFFERFSSLRAGRRLPRFLKSIYRDMRDGDGTSMRLGFWSRWSILLTSEKLNEGVASQRIQVVGHIAELPDQPMR